MYIEYLTFIDLIIPTFYLIIFYFIGNAIKRRNIEANPSYKYYLPGLMVKMLGSILICLVYVFYYGSGDTTAYYHDCVVISKAFFKNPFQMLKLTFTGMDAEVWSVFDFETDWMFYSLDLHAIWVDRLVWPLCLLSFRSFIGTTMLLSFICYQAIWRLYQTLVYEFPTLQGKMAFSVFFIPSVVFWGSGILKDTITWGAVALFISSFHQVLKIKKSYLKNIVFLLVASLLLLKIKPYIFFALIPGTVFWTAGFFLSKVNNKLLKTSITPILIFVSFGMGYLMLGVISNSLGDYRLENVLNKAVVTQQDLKQEYYGGSSFDIGDFDPTIMGILGKAPAAINAAIFRPYLWEANNLGMIVSGVENFVLLILSIYMLIKIRVFNLFRLMFRHHFLFFSVSFSLFFAFSVGLTTSNFGSLVRYKIPAMPLFVASLFVIAETYVTLKREDQEKLLLREDKKPFVIS